MCVGNFVGNFVGDTLRYWFVHMEARALFVSRTRTEFRA